MNKAEVSGADASGSLAVWVRPWITCAIQRRATAPPTRYRIFPNMNCEIFINLAEHYANARCDTPLRPLGLASVLGPKSSAYDHATGPESDWFLIQLTPLGVRDLLGCPLSELTGADHELTAIARDAEPLVDRIAATSCFADRLRAVESWAAVRLCGNVASCRVKALSHLYTVMQASPNLPVHSLARRLGIGERQYRTIVRDEFGIPPKALLGLFRIEHGWNALYRTTSITAASDLFADQAHFSREFQRFTGLTPKSYRRLKESGDGIINGFDHELAQRLGMLAG